MGRATRVMFIALASAAVVRVAPAQPVEFVRVVDDAAGHRLQTAEVMLQHASGVRVTLIATIHVADRGYFESIADDLRRYDAVIHEGTAAPPKSNRTKMPADAIGLASQADVLRCIGERFVTGDFEPPKLTALLAARDNNRGAGVSPARNNENRSGGRDARPTGFSRVEKSKTAIALPLAYAGDDADRATATEALARVALQVDRDVATRTAVESTYAVLERNAVAVRVLQQRLARGDRSVALLYGAAHGADLLERLGRLGFVSETTAWRDAFTIDANH